MFVGARDGNRTRTAIGREILSLLCLPISPPGLAPNYIDAQTRKKGKRPALSLFLFWSGRRVSNSRPIPWQGIALPTELLPQNLGGASRSRTDLHGFAIRCITALLSRLTETSITTWTKPEGFTQKIWSGRRVSNSRPIPWQGIALPTELLPH